MVANRRSRTDCSDFEDLPGDFTPVNIGDPVIPYVESGSNGDLYEWAKEMSLSLEEWFDLLRSLVNGDNDHLQDLFNCYCMDVETGFKCGALESLPQAIPGAVVMYSGYRSDIVGSDGVGGSYLSNRMFATSEQSAAYGVNYSGRIFYQAGSGQGDWQPFQYAGNVVPDEWTFEDCEGENRFPYTSALANNERMILSGVNGQSEYNIIPLANDSVSGMILMPDLYGPQPSDDPTWIDSYSGFSYPFSMGASLEFARLDWGCIWNYKDGTIAIGGPSSGGSSEWRGTTQPYDVLKGWTVNGDGEFFAGSKVKPVCLVVRVQTLVTAVIFSVWADGVFLETVSVNQTLGGIDLYEDAAGYRAPFRPYTTDDYEDMAVGWSSSISYAGGVRYTPTFGLWGWYGAYKDINPLDASYQMKKRWEANKTDASVDGPAGDVGEGDIVVGDGDGGFTVVQRYPAGGSVGEVLTKSGEGAEDVQWLSAFPAGASASDVLTQGTDGPEWGTRASKVFVSASDPTLAEDVNIGDIWMEVSE